MLAADYHAMAYDLSMMKMHAEEADWMRRAVEIYQSKLPETDPDRVYAEQELGKIEEWLARSGGEEARPNSPGE